MTNVCYQLRRTQTGHGILDGDLRNLCGCAFLMSNPSLLVPWRDQVRQIFPDLIEDYRGQYGPNPAEGQLWQDREVVRSWVHLDGRLYGFPAWVTMVGRSWTICRPIRPLSEHGLFGVTTAAPPPPPPVAKSWLDRLKWW